MILRTFASAVDVLAAQGRVQGAECLTNLLGLAGFRHFEVDEVASGGGTHLPFGFLNQEGFGGSHQRGAGLGGDGLDVSCDESVVGGSDDGIHCGMVFKVISQW